MMDRTKISSGLFDIVGQHTNGAIENERRSWVEIAKYTAVSLPFQHANRFQHKTEACTRPPVLRLSTCSAS